MRIQYFCILCMTLWGCAPEEYVPSYGVAQQEIRNGTRQPEAIHLTDGQVLALGWLHSAGEPSGNFCTGTLVAPRVVATARHCIEGGRSRRIGFSVGLMPRNPMATFRVESTHGHPDLDAAILILESDATEQLADIVPIPFNRNPLASTLIGQEIQAGGFGETYDRETSGRFFATVEVSGVSATEVIVDGRGRQGLCFGDSGGPVITRLDDTGPVVLGVESWGDPSCVGVDHLIRLDILTDWIDDVTAEATRPPDPECESLPAIGLCEGQMLSRCDNGRYVEMDCEAEGLECRLDDSTRRLGCFEYDLCADIGSKGACDGETVVRCRFGEVVYDDCAMRDLTCATDSGGAFCTESTDEEPTEEIQPDEMATETEMQDEPDEDPQPDEPQEMANMVDEDTGAGIQTERAQSGGCSTTNEENMPFTPLALLAFVVIALRPTGKLRQSGRLPTHDHRT